ncbi:MAG: HD domain-containing protein [Gammaproteobacteria bacterium]|nr:HD domain-containing protein [Gammaproteobacteria bacterium]MDD2929611.1 HD domain-containing protein [Sideroxydans sp.]
MEPNDPAIKTLYANTKALAVALDYRDPPTQQHSERVRDLATALAHRFGLPEPDIEALNIAASFHDIGKIGVPDQILMKTGVLDDNEWAAMKKHAEIGADIIHATGSAASARAARIIRHHHERYDGSGYPDGLRGEEIPICSRIIGIADSYDAMAVARSYHRARSHDEIMTILHEEIRIKHDPEVLATFCTVIESDAWQKARQ